MNLNARPTGTTAYPSGGTPQIHHGGRMPNFSTSFSTSSIDQTAREPSDRAKTRRMLSRSRWLHRRRCSARGVLGLPPHSLRTTQATLKVMAPKPPRLRLQKQDEAGSGAHVMTHALALVSFLLCFVSWALCDVLRFSEIVSTWSSYFAVFRSDPNTYFS